ncbi:ammonium transporter [Conexibacter woesei]|uniref:Ammonium transporter n=1 Tax=Conexibacter woesei (strain DSM 14684 / CCUG 47730 / CIP 108061 / JCM 11494 / NBRC 100937 / ID131577) TaxID=469383 RepID=D3F545_CONWI|nr:ammonium transporter [Conexibacter woesei]ADB48623.1 ammonium transporter [Conexibacter woesei DSM 14684]
MTESLVLAARSLGEVTIDLDALWLVVAAVLVMFMQAGFACVEIGFSRGRNAGAVVAKVLFNFSLVTLVWWACGFALAFGGGAWLLGDSGFFLHVGETISAGSPIAGTVTSADTGYVFFQLAFCAVSFAIVWGTTLERIRFVAYPIYGVVFAALIYPLVAHSIFGGGLLGDVGDGMQDFAGSTVVHLTGATGGLAALLLLGPRRGKYGPDGSPRAIPGHSMPMFGVGVLILWLGWFGFNAGSTLTTAGARFAEVALVTNLAAAAGVIGATLTVWLLTRRLDVGMIGNGAIGALVAITAPSGYIELWAAPLIGAVAGALVVVSVLAIDRKLDDPVGALSAHGVAGVWGTLSCGLFAAPRLVDAPGVPGEAGLVYSGSFEQLGVQALGVLVAFLLVFTLSYLTFAAIKALFGLRVTDEEEQEGLDIVEHGMYGYPEQFIVAGDGFGEGFDSLPER